MVFSPAREKLEKNRQTARSRVKGIFMIDGSLRESRVEVLYHSHLAASSRLFWEFVKAWPRSRKKLLAWISTIPRPPI
jgi:hypothetical protein